MRRRRGPKRKTVPPPPSPPAKNEIDDDDETEDDDVEVEVVDESTTVHPYDGRLRSRKRRDAVASRPRYQRRRRRSSSSSRPPTPRLIRIDDRGNFIESGEGVPDPFKWQGTVHPLLIPDVIQLNNKFLLNLTFWNSDKKWLSLKLSNSLFIRFSWT